ncbi:TetR/AcrR family transcriptional regulator [Terasakiella pusilla]|uniref:TetR/AcrR family transcriptional regulator n=1 Tax=Terasakiella pusilla TaxID=64973 RepID=UPI003AA7D7D9
MSDQDEKKLSPKQQKKREEIITVARDLLFTHGYDALSMDRVQQQVGGSKRTLYQHFKNRDDLFIVIVRQVADRALAALDFQEEKPLGLRENLQQKGERYLNVLLSEEGLMLFRYAAFNLHQFPDFAESFFENGPNRATRQLATFFEERARDGQLKLSNAPLLAQQFLGAVRGDMHLAAVFTNRQPSAAETKTAVTHAVDQFLSLNEV